MDQKLGVKTRTGAPWGVDDKGYARVYAIGACNNIDIVDKIMYRNIQRSHFGYPLKLHNMHWPWGAGMFATSLGPDDAVFVAGANWEKGSGYIATWASLSAVQKEIIEASKTDECAFGFIGRCIWYFVHHTPVHLWGGGPLWGYQSCPA